MIFDTLVAKSSLTVACNRRLVFASETRIALNKRVAKGPMAFWGGFYSKEAEEREQVPVTLKKRHGNFFDTLPARLCKRAVLIMAPKRSII